MSPAAVEVGHVSPSETGPAMTPAMTGTGTLSPAQKDKVIDWYKGEFAAANAIIDALCHHLVQISGENGNSEIPEKYDGVFSAIHRRRLNWIPVLQMQKYFTISDISHALRKAAGVKPQTNDVKAVVPERNEKKQQEAINGGGGGGQVLKMEDELLFTKKKGDDDNHNDDDDVKCNGNENNGHSHACVGSEGDDDSPNSEITETGSHEVPAPLEHVEICDNHEDCALRREQIKLTKGFVAKEPVKGHMVNVVKGLKMYENLFTDVQLLKLSDFVNELRAAGQKGELLGETYILFNKQIKANKREQIQLGVPIFGQIKDDATQQQNTNIEHIPELLHSVIDHLVQWQVLPENRRPNGCIIKYFDEGEYSQPFLKPPHLDQPLCTLVLSESTMAYGRTLVNDGEGNYKGQLMLSLKQGSLLVMRNNSADMARHVTCASPSKRVSITFFRVRPDSLRNHHSAPLSSPVPQSMTICHSGMPSPQAMTNVDHTMDVIPKWGVIRAPVVMLAPMSPVVMNPRNNLPCGGTGVFLPWAVGSRKPAKHLPPRAQRGRFYSYARVQEHNNVSDTMSDPGVEGRVM